MPSITNPSQKPTILYISLSKHLTGEPIIEGVTRDFQAKASPPSISSSFSNQGFDVTLDSNNSISNLHDLRRTLREQPWDGVLIGWCLRGHPERTVMFEQAVDVCVEEIVASSGGDVGKRTKLVFCSGPDDLYHAVMRSFGDRV